jgi:hypothetical protein
MFLEQWAHAARSLMKSLADLSSGPDRVEYTAKAEVLEAMIADFTTFKLNEKKGKSNGKQRGA